MRRATWSAIWGAVAGIADVAGSLGLCAGAPTGGSARRLLESVANLASGLRAELRRLTLLRRRSGGLLVLHYGVRAGHALSGWWLFDGRLYLRRWRDRQSANASAVMLSRLASRPATTVRMLSIRTTSRLNDRRDRRRAIEELSRCVSTSGAMAVPRRSRKSACG